MPASNFAFEESQRRLRPIFQNKEWPQLKQLTLVGMGATEVVNMLVSHLQDRVHVEQRLGGIERIGGCVTPDQISTPGEFGGY